MKAAERIGRQPKASQSCIYADAFHLQSSRPSTLPFRNASLLERLFRKADNDQTDAFVHWIPMTEVRQMRSHSAINPVHDSKEFEMNTRIHGAPASPSSNRANQSSGPFDADKKNKGAIEQLLQGITGSSSTSASPSASDSASDSDDADDVSLKELMKKLLANSAQKADASASSPK